MNQAVPFLPMLAHTFTSKLFFVIKNKVLRPLIHFDPRITWV